jgi:periplasmic mercuric ion binding protein
MKPFLIVILIGLGISGIASAEIKTITLDIPKIDCPLCPITVKAALEKIEGVDSVTADLDTKSATVTFDDTIVTVQAFIDATTNAGYPSEIKP